MANLLEIRREQKNLLIILLKLKKLNDLNQVNGLQEEINYAVSNMEKEDIAWVEQAMGIKAL